MSTLQYICNVTTFGPAGTDLAVAVALVVIISYLLGSVSFAVLVSKILVGDDVRRHGSGNAGMTNILRTYGKRLAVFTGIGDFAKAVAAVMLSRYIFAKFGLAGTVPVDAGYISGLFVQMGHLFPLYFHFKGGKGVLVSLGIILIVNPLAFLILAVIFVPLVFITKIVSLASVLGAVFFPFLTYFTLRLQGIPALYDTIFATILAAVVFVAHRDNIKRLLNGTEHRFGQKK